MHNLNATLMLFYTIPKKPRIFKIVYPFLLLYKLYLNLYRCKSKSRALSLPVCKTLCQLYYTLSTFKFFFVDWNIHIGTYSKGHE